MARAPATRIGVPNTPPTPSAHPAGAPPRTAYALPPGATAAEYARKRYGSATRMRELRPAIGTTPTAALGQNPKRLFWQVVNTSVNSMSYGQDFSLSIANGLPLSPSGGGASMSVDEDAEAVTYPVLLTASIAASATYVIEVESI